MSTRDQNCYFPLPKGRYEVTPGLNALGTDFGNGHDDNLIFQIDANFPRYREEKITARKERLEKYYCAGTLAPDKKSYITRFIINQLCEEHPSLFHHQKRNNHHHLFCQLTDDILKFNSDFVLLNPLPDSNGYVDSLDGLAMQVQEDIALVEITDNGHDCITALHLCFPNHWAAEDKIGQSFLDSHAPVPGMAKINQHADRLLTNLLHRGPFVRFAWGLATDDRLNHHPVTPDYVNTEQWQGRCFNPTNPVLFLRVERQVIQGFPAINTLLFTIRTYFYDVAILKRASEKRQALQSALQSMSAATLHYKGLTQNQPFILDWLNRD
jgi:hypothetical protein